MGEKKNAEGLVGIPNGQRPLAGPRPRLEDYIKVDLKETGRK
jgi:hypothetical protein